MAQACVLRDRLSPELVQTVLQFIWEKPSTPSPTAALIKSLRFEYTEQEIMPGHRENYLRVYVRNRPDHFHVTDTEDQQWYDIPQRCFLLTDFQPSAWSLYFETSGTERFFRSSMDQARRRVLFDFAKMFD